MNRTHPSLHRAPEYSVTPRHVLHGCSIVAWLKHTKHGTLHVHTLKGVVIGEATTPAEAMLMVIGNQRRQR